MKLMPLVFMRGLCFQSVDRNALEKKLRPLKVCHRAARTTMTALCFLLDLPQRCVGLWNGLQILSRRTRRENATSQKGVSVSRLISARNVNLVNWADIAYLHEFSRQRCVLQPNKQTKGLLWSFCTRNAPYFLHLVI
jgi:hypothetical protein